MSNRDETPRGYLGYTQSTAARVLTAEEVIETFNAEREKAAQSTRGRTRREPEPEDAQPKGKTRSGRAASQRDGAPPKPPKPKKPPKRGRTRPAPAEPKPKQPKPPKKGRTRQEAAEPKPPKKGKTQTGRRLPSKVPTEHHTQYGPVNADVVKEIYAERASPAPLTAGEVIKKLHAAQTPPARPPRTRAAVEKTHSRDTTSAPASGMSGMSGLAGALGGAGLGALLGNQASRLVGDDEDDDSVDWSKLLLTGGGAGLGGLLGHLAQQRFAGKSAQSTRGRTRREPELEDAQPKGKTRTGRAPSQRDGTPPAPAEPKPPKKGRTRNSAAQAKPGLREEIRHLRWYYDRLKEVRAEDRRRGRLGAKPEPKSNYEFGDSKVLKLDDMPPANPAPKPNYEFGDSKVLKLDDSPPANSAASPATAGINLGELLKTRGATGAATLGGAGLGALLGNQASRLIGDDDEDDDSVDWSKLLLTAGGAGLGGLIGNRAMARGRGPAAS